MRAVLVEVLLALVVAFCLAFLVFAGSLGFDRLAFAGIGLLLLSSLFAAISALGPKYEPTPFLTPMMAGTMTAIVATTLVFASTAGLPQNDNPLTSDSAPAETLQASLEPAPAPMQAETMEDVPMDAPPVRVVEPPAEETDALALIIEDPVEPAAPRTFAEPPPEPVVEEDVFVSEPAPEPLPVEEEPPSLVEAAPAPSTAPAASPQAEPPPTRLVQAPAAAAPDPNAPLQLNPAVGGPAPTAAPTPTQVLIPPLPRIRPR